MLDWPTIAYGAALAAVAAGVLAGIAAREARAAAALAAMAAAGGGSLAWNAILRATHAAEFFTDAPISALPASWQDAGSGVFTVALASLILGWLSHPWQSSARTATIAALAGLAAFAVDVYLY